MRFSRRGPLPADVLARMPLPSGDRVLAGARATGGAWAVATLDAFVLLEDDSVVERLTWPEVERAEWNRDDEVLEVVAVGEYAAPRATYRLAFEDSGRLLEVIRERVSASVVLQRRVTVSGRSGLFVIARRATRGDAPIAWMYEFDAGVDPEDPDVRRLAEAGLRAAREELGL